MSVTSTLKLATKAAASAFKPGAEGSASDILDTLKKEHDQVKELLGSLQSADGAAERRSLVKQIKAALIPHTKAEEKVVYDAIVALKDKEAQTHGREGYLEHELAAKTLQRLEKIDNPTSPEHKELVEHHIEEEESSIWDDVKQNFDDAGRRRMNAAFEAAKARVKIH
jgi:hemerythrin superfamily protein